MDKDTADAITVIEKQMAEKDQKIATMRNDLDHRIAEIAALRNRMARIEQAALAFAKGVS